MSTKGIVLAVYMSAIMIISNCYTTYADYDDSYYYDDYEFYYYFDEPDYSIPSDIWFEPFGTIISSDEIKIRWTYEGEEPCVVYVRDSDGNVSKLPDEGGHKVTILSNKLEKGGRYSISVHAGSDVSQTVILDVADNKAEIVEIISRTNVEPVEHRIDRSIVLPEGSFNTKESADKMVKTINVKVWQINSKGEKITATLPITVNVALVDTVTKIFDEIYQNELRFPIKSLSAYSYRTTASGNRLSEHAYGTAIDINPDENHCVYSSGNTVGNCYEPYKNPYSLTPEIINIFRKYNFGWGGSFNDYMHFSYFGT
ncbi:MAG: M15 family metallopeptidase [Firmicutes bacterium]|nr:M15 family metallopeptidase [Bacillota bacterium]